MFSNEPIAQSARRTVAEEALRSFIGRYGGDFAPVIAADMKKNVGSIGEVVVILVKANMRLGSHSFEDAEIEIRRMNAFRRIYLSLLRMLRMVECQDIPRKETICGLAVTITFKVITSR